LKSRNFENFSQSLKMFRK